MVFEKIKEILAEGLGLDFNEITLDSNIIEDLGADSLDMVEIVMAIEDEFSIDIQDEDIETIKTVEDIVKYIEDKE